MDGWVEDREGGCLMDGGFLGSWIDPFSPSLASFPPLPLPHPYSVGLLSLGFFSPGKGRGEGVGVGDG